MAAFAAGAALDEFVADPRNKLPKTPFEVFAPGAFAAVACASVLGGGGGGSRFSMLNHSGHRGALPPPPRVHFE